MEIKRVVVNLRHNVFKPLAAMEPEPITYDTTHTRFKAVTACCSASSLQFLLFAKQRARSPEHRSMLAVLELLLLLLYGVAGIRCSTVPENSTDMLSLIHFRKAINDPAGALHNWDTRCSTKHPGRVTALNLAGQGLSGTIPASLGNLTFVRILDLSNNNFSGQMPDLSNLQKIQVLNLSYNSLGGIIPDTLTNCSNLKELHLYHNSLRDQVYLELNQLGGNIPDELSQFSNITVLGLGDNMLSGSIPSSLFNLSSLQALELSGNQLGGTLPVNMGDHLTNLKILYMSHIMLEGHIPASLGNASMLQEIVLQSNNFTGRIPTSLGKLLRLSKLDLQLNTLEAKDAEGWEFLDALRNCSVLRVLALANNQLQGIIPNSIGSLPGTVQYLILGGNELSGIIPPSIGNFSRLIQLTLDENSLTGTIGQWIGDLKYLQLLHLGQNNFTGPIPPTIGNLTELTKLYLTNNNFEGSIYI